MTESVELTHELIAICRVFAAFEKERVCCGQVTVAQCVTLQALLEGPSEAAQLADRQGVKPSTMTRLLDGMESRGWIERTPNSRDRRRLTISLSKEGRKEARRLREVTRRCLAEVLAGIPTDKHAVIGEAMSLVRTALERTFIRA